MDDVDADLGVVDLRELAGDGLDRALDVRLDDDVELAERALLICVKSSSSEMPFFALRRELLGADALAAQLREMARLALVLDDAGVLAGRRRLVEAEDLDRGARRRLLDLLAAEVESARTLPQASPATMASPTRIVPRGTSIVATGPRPTSRRLSMIGPEASAFAFAVELELGVRDEEDLLEQVVDALAGLGRDVGELRRRRPTPPAGGRG